MGRGGAGPEHSYHRPDRFDLGRRADDHLAFGLGKHFCLGYHLARLEVRAACSRPWRACPTCASTRSRRATCAA